MRWIISGKSYFFIHSLRIACWYAAIHCPEEIDQIRFQYLLGVESFPKVIQSFFRGSSKMIEVNLFLQQLKKLYPYIKIENFEIFIPHKNHNFISLSLMNRFLSKIQENFRGCAKHQFRGFCLVFELFNLSNVWCHVKFEFLSE